MCLILRAREAADAFERMAGRNKGRPKVMVSLPNQNADMNKTLDVIKEVISNPKHPFRKADSHPKKAVKHRYERRKIKEYLHLGDWQTEEAM